jgi:hypothetical protein
MKINKLIKAALLLPAIICPLFCFAQGGSDLHFKAETMAAINLVLVVTSLISIKQFFWPGVTDNTPFHVLHIAVVVVFYIIGIWFLIANKQAYSGLERISGIGVILRFFFSFGLDSLKQWVILFGLAINVLYIVRKSKSVI